MASKIGERINHVIDLGLTPLLTEAGFQKERKTFRRSAGEQTQIVNIRSGKYNYGDRGNFLANFGVFVPRFHEFWSGNEFKRKPALQDCQFFCQLHHLMPNRRTTWWENFWGTPDENSDDHLMPSKTNTWAENVWWELRENSDDDAVAAGLVEAVGNYGLPWLEICSDPSQAREYLESKARTNLSNGWPFGVELLLKFEITYRGKEAARTTLNSLIESSFRGRLFKWPNNWLFGMSDKEIRDYLAKTTRELGLL